MVSPGKSVARSVGNRTEPAKTPARSLKLKDGIGGYNKSAQLRSSKASRAELVARGAHVLRKSDEAGGSEAREDNNHDSGGGWAINTRLEAEPRTISEEIS
jgi:hypothetical protein